MGLQELFCFKRKKKNLQGSEAWLVQLIETAGNKPPFQMTGGLVSCLNQHEKLLLMLQFAD